MCRTCMCLLRLHNCGSGLHSRVFAVLCCWLQELERHTAAFVEQARLLATWDSAVLNNRHALLDLEAELRAVHAGQEALARQLGMIETHQKVGPDSQQSALERYGLQTACTCCCSTGSDDGEAKLLCSCTSREHAVRAASNHAQGSSCDTAESHARHITPSVCLLTVCRRCTTP